MNISSNVITLLVSHFDKSGKLFKLLQKPNNADILVTFLVSQFDISGKNLTEEHFWN